MSDEDVTRHQQDEHGEQAEQESLFSLLLPYLVGTSICTLLVALLAVHYLIGGSIGGKGKLPKMVTFDVIKYVNAQRAVAGSFLTLTAKQDDTQTFLMDISKRTQEIITQKAGPDTLILVKQSVVNTSRVVDITDAVLKELDLPTNVPTQDYTRFNLDETPTSLGLSGLSPNPPPLPARSQENHRDIIP